MGIRHPRLEHAEIEIDGLQEGEKSGRSYLSDGLLMGKSRQTLQFRGLIRGPIVGTGEVYLCSLTSSSSYVARRGFYAVKSLQHVLSIGSARSSRGVYD